MITFNIRGHHGFSNFNTSSLRGHLRPIDKDIGVVDDLRSDLLHAMGRRVDKSSNFEYIHNVRLFDGDKQGEK